MDSWGQLVGQGLRGSGIFVQIVMQIVPFEAVRLWTHFTVARHMGGKRASTSRASGTAAAGPPPGPRAGSLSPVLAYFLPTAPGRLRGSRILTDSADPDRSRILTDTGGTGRHSTPPDP